MAEILKNDEWQHLIEAQNKTGLIDVDRQAGVVRMCDLVTGKPLEAGEVPPSMRQDAVYRKGFEAFQELTKKYNSTVDLILNNHGGEADAERLLSNHSDIMESATLGFIEINTRYTDAHERPLEVAIQPDFDDPNEGLVSYTRVQVDALERLGVLPLPIDVDVSPDSETQRALVGAVEEMGKHSGEARSAVYGAYQNARQYGFIAKIGMWLEQIEAQQPNLLHDDMKMVVMLGSYHEAMIGKFEQFGVNVHAPITDDRRENEHDPTARAFYAMTGQAQVGADVLRRGARR